MTQTKQITKRTHRHPPFRGQLLFGWFSLFCILLIFKNGTLASQYIHRGLLICANSVIPSLFPFMVLSELLISSGFGEKLLSRITLPLCRLFLLPSPCVTAMLLGLLCGFPVGARTAAAYAARGKITQEELEHLLCFCNVPSAAFLINAVGASLYADAAFGRLLLGAAVVSAALCGLLYRLIFRSEARSGQGQAAEPLMMLRTGGDSGVDTSLGASLAAAAGGMISVVATVLFFGAVLGALRALLARLQANTLLSMPAEGTLLLSALLSCFFELTGGVASAAALRTAGSARLCALSPILCAAAVGWGGLSVLCQLLAVCGDLRPRIRLGRFFLARGLQAVLCCLGSMLVLVLPGVG
jgi:sporulation integral membrane protein YlbJ